MRFSFLPNFVKKSPSAISLAEGSKALLPRSTKPVDDVVGEFLKSPKTKSLLEQSVNEANPRDKFWENPDFKSRGYRVAIKAGSLGVSWYGAKVFYAPAAHNFVSQLVEEGVINPANKDAWGYAFSLGTVVVNGPFIVAGGESTFKFVAEHTWGDGKRIYNGELPKFHIFVSFTSLAVLSGVAYLGTFGPYDIAQREYPDEFGNLIFCNVVNTVGNSAGGAGVAQIVVLNVAEYYLKPKPDQSLANHRKKTSYGTINEPETREEDIESAVEREPTKVNPNINIRDRLEKDLRLLAAKLSNIRPEHAKSLYNNASFMELFNQVLILDNQNKPRAFLDIALQSSLLLTDKQQPLSNLEKSMKALLVALASAPSQVGLIMAGLNYVNTMDISDFLKWAAYIGAIVAPLAMVTVFGWNFTDQSTRLNPIDLSGAFGVIGFYSILLMPLFFAFCCFSYSATAGTGLEYIGMGSILLIALSTIIANFAPGRVVLRDLIQDVALFLGHKEISKATAFIHQIDVVKALLQTLADKVEVGEISETDCQLLSDLVAQYYMHMNGAEFQTTIAVIDEGGGASSDADASRKSAPAETLTSYNLWVKDRAAPEAQGFFKRMLMIQNPALLTVEEYLNGPNMMRFAPLPPPSATDKKLT